MNWDDLRYVLAVADHGTVSSAARELGVSHATVLRHVASFEADHNGQVFDRGPTGYQVRDDRRRVIEAARDVAQAVGTVDRLMHGSRAPMRGRVRISSTDSMCRFILPGAVLRMREVAPELQLDLLSSNQHVDIARLQADISVRPTHTLPEDMVGDPVAEMAFHAYATPEAPERWLGLQGPLGRAAVGQWMQKDIDPGTIISGSDSFVVLAELAQLGLGHAALPAFVGDRYPALRRCPGRMPDLRVPLWIATHVDLNDSPRIRRVRDQLADHLRGCASQLSGTA